jgi:hypothetical protein
VDFDGSPRWPSQQLFFWRLTLQQLLAGFKSPADSQAAWSKLASQTGTGQLCKSLGVFLKSSVGPWLLAKQQQVQGGGKAGSKQEQQQQGGGSSQQAHSRQQREVAAALERCVAAEKLLSSSQGALLAI